MQSPAHRFGQIIGEVLEAAVVPLLADFARKHGLYLDKHGRRPCRRGLKCKWQDLHGNMHDLDFVLERGGTADNIGVPAAFIETAWRRYTKHSRNKAQEIQGAIMPLAETYRNAAPFVGAILAGVFTSGALAQLKSLGFTLLHFPYESVIQSFKKHGINAAFDEKTSDTDFQSKVDAYGALSARMKSKIARHLIAMHSDEVNVFIASLAAAISRQVERIVILPLHGTAREVSTVTDAIAFVKRYNEKTSARNIQRYEIEIRYNNGNRIKGESRGKEDAIVFLQSYLPANPAPQ